MAVNAAHARIGPEFAQPPRDPLPLLRDWFTTAADRGVREPGAIALATVNPDGEPTSRMIQLSRFTGRGLVFATHASSRKGRDIADAGRWSGVAYWRETNQQVTFGGHAHDAGDAVADELWAGRPVAANAMSAVTRQSEPLGDARDLPARAEALAEGGPVPRPGHWVAYELVVTHVEFWQSSADRLYRRLRYDLTESGWAAVRLQP
ncbi:pyridoxal 5'-phosphate synthase [Amycolatopsis sp. NPDC059657]|uniref:pyridoxal 5'-phosphate synthase n=1 Tax=Amycolatopsis sp. NPDC059657 TaxID=3346899 RepID=UPI00367033AA